MKKVMTYAVARDESLCKLCTQWGKLPGCMIAGEFEFGNGLGEDNVYQCSNFISNGTNTERITGSVVLQKGSIIIGG